MSKTIIITGVSSGLGKSFTEYLSKENEVIIICKNENELKKVSKLNNCYYKVCDITDFKKS